MADGVVSWFAGVDWGSERHQVCLLDAAGQVVGERAFRHGGAGLAALCDWLVVCEKGCLGAQAGVGAARHASCRTTRAAQSSAHKALSQATRSRRLWPAAARMALIASP